MRLVDEQISISNIAICKDIEIFEGDDRGFLSQSILIKLRTFVEAVAVKACGKNEYSYEIYQNEAKNQVSSNANLKFLSKFHKFLQRTVSHYLPDEGNSERLMLKYYEYLLRIKSFLKDAYNFEVLENIDDFPVALDPALKEYFEKIAEKINQPISTREKGLYNDRYYIRKIKPFFVNKEVYYEVTFTTAIDRVSKFDRVIAFTKSEILPNYAVKLGISNDVIEVFGKTMPIQIIDNWEVSIRPCELNNFADIFGDHSNISATSSESRNLMTLLQKTGLNLVEIMELSDDYYQHYKNIVLDKAKTIRFFDVLDRCRELIENDHAGSNIVRYLLYSLNNKIVKLQYNDSPCVKLSNLNLEWGCIPFDEMPFVTSPIGHNPKIHDLFDCINPDGREHELFARHIKNNTEINGHLYTPSQEITGFENIDQLIWAYNSKLYRKHRPLRNLEKYKNHIFINGYEHDTFHVIEKIKEYSDQGIKNYSNSVATWLNSGSDNVDCDSKKSILKEMFSQSRVALIYGSAGTGKTRLIEHLSNFFHEHDRLYLANTNPAVNNLNTRISTGKSTFMTIASFLHNSNHDSEYDLLIIDECSTVSNSNMLQVLEKASFKLLVLVGDVFQIESIRFGNWFGIAQSFIPATSVFELTKPYRSNNEGLLNLWSKVRNIDDSILEHITFVCGL